MHARARRDTSYCSAVKERSSNDKEIGSAPNETSDEWLFGGQIFGDFVYRINWFDFGISAKYQLVQDFEEVAADFSNLRLGFKLGVIF